MLGGCRVLNSVYDLGCEKQKEEDIVAKVLEQSVKYLCSENVLSQSALEGPELSVIDDGIS